MKFGWVIQIIGLVLVLGGAALVNAKAQEKPDQNDYVRKVQELSAVQSQLYVEKQKNKMLEEAAKKAAAPAPEEKH
jgi:outer membrane murein-binding lipoprotein Lpp